MIQAQPVKELLASLLKIQKGSLHDRVYGCLFGQLLGDSVGGLLEFKPDITEQDVELAFTMPGGGELGVAPGQVNEDSEMAMAILKSLQNGKFSQEQVARGYDDWFQSSPVDMGVTTTNALKREKDFIPQSFAQYQLNNTLEKNKQSQSNGTLMRISPLGMYCALKGFGWEQVKDVAEQATVLTHCNENVLQITELWVYILSQLQLLQGNSEQDIRDVLGKCDKIVEGLVIKNLYDQQTEPDFQQQTGYIGHSFTYGIQTLRKYKENISFYDYLRQIFLKGGDTNTNACILGAMMGSILGFHQIYQEKPELVDILLNCQPNQGRQEYASINAVQMSQKLIESIAQQQTQS